MARTGHSVTILTSTGDVVPNAPIEIRLYSTGGLANIFEQNGTQITQLGATADSNGIFRFWAEPDEYFARNGVVDVPVTVGVDKETFSQRRGVPVKTLADAVADESAEAGDYVDISDRGMGRFTYMSGQANNGFNIVQAHGGLSLVLQVERPVNIKTFGCIGDYNGTTGTNNSPALQAIIDYLAPLGGGELYVPFGRYHLQEGIDWATGQFKIFKMTGETVIFTTFETDQDIVMFTHDGVTFENFSMLQNGGHQNSRALSTPTDTQTLHTTYDKLFITGFKFGVWWRFSIWNTIKNCVFRDNLCGMKFSRNPFPDDQSNPAATAPWNTLGGGGFFHNENTFENNLIIGGEVGVYGTLHTCTFNGITCQDQKIASTANNKVLPVGLQGVGMYLQNSGFDSSSFGASGNTINTLYTEVTSQPMITEYVGLSLGSCFVQGSTFAEPFPQAFRFIGGEIETRGGNQTGGDWWERLVVASDGAVVTSKLEVGAFKTSEYLISSGAQYFRNRDNQVNKTTYNGLSVGDTRSIIGGLSTKDVLTVSVGAIYNGSVALSAGFDVYYFNDTIFKIATRNGSDANLQLGVSSANLEITISGAVGTYDVESVVTILNNAASV